MKIDTIEEALEDLKQGKLVIVVDDENRENEGDFVCAGECVTPEIINFMIKNGKGQVCTPLTAERCKELRLELMVNNNTALHSTPFTIPVDVKGRGTTTGISAFDRTATVKALIDEKTQPDDLLKPGHMFPLMAKEGGVLRRAGHTEAAVDLARLAGFKPVGVIVEIIKEDGDMARLPDLRKIADKHKLKLITIEDLIHYRLEKETLVESVEVVKLPTRYGDFQMHLYKQINTENFHYALTKGVFNESKPILLRVHSSCLTGDIFSSSRCDCGLQLETAMKMIEKEGKGAVIYLNQEGRGIGIEAKIKAYKLQEQGMDTVEANIHLGYKSDNRDYGIGAQIIRDIGIRKIRLISNNPKKRVGLTGYNLEIVENIPIEVSSNPHNEEYLKTKKNKMGHTLNIIE